MNAVDRERARAEQLLHELLKPKKLNCRRQDSHLRSPHYKWGALTTWPQRLIHVKSGLCRLFIGQSANLGRSTLLLLNPMSRFNKRSESEQQLQ